MDQSIRAEGGLSKITFAVFAIIIGAALYSGYHIGHFFYDYFEMKNHMATVIRVASQNTDEEIRAKLWYHMKKMDIPAEKEDLRIEREDRTMRISLEWEETFFVTWEDKDYDIHTFKFHAYEEGQF